MDSLELRTGSEKVGDNQRKGVVDYMPFATTYFEEPRTSGYANPDIHALTSVTFSTFKGIPLVDDAD